MCCTFVPLFLWLILKSQAIFLDLLQFPSPCFKDALSNNIAIFNSRRRRGGNKKSKSMAEENEAPSDPVVLKRMTIQTPGLMDHPPIPVNELSDRIRDMRAESNAKFTQEYEVNADRSVIFNHCTILVLPSQHRRGGAGLILHFGVHFSHYFKARLIAKSLLWISVFIHRAVFE